VSPDCAYTHSEDASNAKSAQTTIGLLQFPRIDCSERATVFEVMPANALKDRTTHGTPITGPAL
jgi:hypothetical protein